MWALWGLARRTAVAAFAILAPTLCAGHAAEIQVDSAMYLDPRIEPPGVVAAFSSKLKPLWLQALARPEADLQRQAAESIAKAHQLGMPGLADTAGPLMETLAAPDQHPVVRLAVARTLIVLEARQAASLLFEQLKLGPFDMAQLVEPALADWDYRPIRNVWLWRLEDPQAPKRSLILAIQGLGTVGGEEAKPLLRAFVNSSNAAAEVRLAAARALGGMGAGPYEDDVRSLGADKSRKNIGSRLAAVWLLTGNRGKAARALLAEMALDPEPAVSALAAARLLDVDAQKAIQIAGRWIVNADPGVRRCGVLALAAESTPDAVARLGSMLDDPHPDVRGCARDLLFELSRDPELGEAVRRAAMDMLASERWRGLEQALLLVGALDHEPAADRLLELLDFQRPEVFVTAAWALRRLAIPATLGPMFEKVQLETYRKDSPATNGTRPRRSIIMLDMQASQLIQAFGQMRYAPSESLLRKCVPRGGDGIGDESRAAAIWVLGYFHEADPAPDLARQFLDRATDFGGLTEPPEDERVRNMSKISLGRMKATSALSTLRSMMYEAGDSHCHWAVEQITGETLPPCPPPERPQRGWFLEPMD